jgi:hypothetical protein
MGALSVVTLDNWWVAGWEVQRAGTMAEKLALSLVDKTGDVKARQMV